MLEDKKLIVVASYYRAGRFARRWGWGVRRAWRALPAELRSRTGVLVVHNDPQPGEAQGLERALRGVDHHVLAVERESLYASWNRAVRVTPGATAYAMWNLDDLRTAAGLAEQFALVEGADGDALAWGPLWELTYQRWPLTLGLYRVAPRAGAMPPFFCLGRAALARVGLFNEVFRISGDTEWLARYLAAGGRVLEGRRQAGLFVNHGGGLSQQARKENLAESLLLEHLHPGFKRSTLSLYQDYLDRLAPPPRLADGAEEG